MAGSSKQQNCMKNNWKYNEARVRRRAGGPAFNLRARTAEAKVAHEINNISQRRLSSPRYADGQELGNENQYHTWPN